MSDVPTSGPAPPTHITPDRSPAEAESDDGVDVTLIRWMLALSTKERLDALQANTDALVRLRDAASQR